jgi:N-carbamoyl-L-amino-acid hydrolase
VENQILISDLRINLDRLLERLNTLAEIGAIDGGGNCRLALTDEDRRGRDLVRGWMKDLGLEISIDQIGNVIGVRAGTENGDPILTGSHIDTVATGGRFDGNLGVLAGLEIIETLNETGRNTRKPLGVGFFTNEEGVRFAPDMMGSAVHQGVFDVDDMLAVVGIDGTVLGDELQKIGYAGKTPAGRVRADCFVELHVEQGPVLEKDDVEIGAVDSVQGISWTEYRLAGTSNHAGTTPMHLRHDAGYVAAAISCEARRIALEMGGAQVATVGVNELGPGLINVIANEALVSVDLRNTDNLMLQKAEKTMADFVETICEAEGVSFTSRALVRFEPVTFDKSMVDIVSESASTLGYSVKTMPSGAGHDAQMFARNCPTSMIFIPSQNGISHNVKEYSSPEQIQKGADVLLQVLLKLTS